MDGQLAFGFSGTERKVKLGEIQCKDHYQSISSDTPIEITATWGNAFSPFEKSSLEDHFNLREPQIGAIHAVIAHWTTTVEPATVVMPTGTGKTETMLSLLLADSCEKVLVVVPSDPLRKQTFSKFVKLGILPKLKGFNESIKYPVVGKILHIPKTIDEVDEMLAMCNVLVAIPTSLSRAPKEVLDYIADKVSHLIIDESHHVSANQWHKLKGVFTQKQKKVLQFTATPFRNDNRPIEGKIIYNYPLKLSFSEGYFKTIHFEEVLEWDSAKSDEAIASKAISILKDDISKYDYDHLILARADTINRAKEIIKVYEELGKEFNPQLIYSQLTTRQKKERIELVIKRESRIIVCVDMFGEGFDLPNLKIAAIHDVHKSLPITLQFTGRFTRTVAETNIGDAKVIANIALADVSDALQQLYSQDADWNEILQYQSDSKIKKQIGLEEFIESFTKGNYEEISLQNLRPKMSTVVFKMSAGASWSTKVLEKRVSSNKDQIIKTAVNEKDKVMVIIEGKRSYIEWGRFKDINNLIWDLYLIYWDQESNLLYINSSNNNSLHENLAKDVGGDGTLLIKGDQVFRAFHGINRLIFQNVGLNSARGQAIRYTMYTGIDVEQGLSDAQTATKFKSNLFGIGFEKGDKSSVGCSYKGRVWSRRNSNIADFTEWCRSIGKKLLDSNINTDEILKNALKRVEINELPNDTFPISIEWDQGIYDVLLETPIEILNNSKLYNIDDVSIDIVKVDETKNTIEFKIWNTAFETTYALKVFENADGISDFVISQVDGKSIEVIISGQKYSFIDYSREFPPVIRFSDGSFLEGNIYAKVQEVPTFYSKDRIETLKWSEMGVDITKESQGKQKDEDSIQYQLIRELEKKNYLIIFDDDSAGEIADVVAINVDESTNTINVELYHCKYSSGNLPGSRISDIYEVCGQAQKSIQWLSRRYRIFTHLIRRSQETNVGGFERGSKELALELRNKCKSFYQMKFFIYIVQPGLSKEKVSQDQLKILGATETYLKETYMIPFTVIASK